MSISSELWRYKRLIKNIKEHCRSAIEEHKTNDRDCDRETELLDHGAANMADDILKMIGGE